jgi:hypothetical protein
VAVKGVWKPGGSVSGRGSNYSCRSSFGFHGKTFIRDFNFVPSLRLSVFENMIVRKVFGHKMYEITGDCKRL